MSSSPRDLLPETISVTTTIPMSYRHRAPKNRESKLLVLFLHGYTDHGGSFLKRLYQDQWPETFKDVSLLAPNGPFPVPVRSESGWREAYSWYFYDDKLQKMVISPETAALGCEQLLAKLGFETIPKVIVGFSQGGYLAPFLASRIKNVQEIIGVGTGYREDYYPTNSPWRVTAIHGAKDEVFPIAEAKVNHAKVRLRAQGGDFSEIADLGHSASAEVGKIIEARVREITTALDIR